VAWSSLGTVTPSFDWRFYPLPCIGTAAVRITQAYTLGEVTWRNRLFLGEFYGTPDGEFRFLRSLRPGTTPELFELRIPETLEVAGYTLRHFAIRHNWNGVSDVANWTVHIEEWL
jgi:hypothetical protein